MKRKIGFAVVTFCFYSLLFSQSINSLLESYLENDLTLKNLIIQKQKAQLSQESTKISNGFDITLSTGTMNIRFANGNTTFSVRPSVDMSIPQAKNLSLKAGSNISISSGNENSAGTIFSDTSLSVGIDIISDKDLNRKITLMKAERSVKEADWRLLTQALTAEKNFYSELKSLFSKAQNIMSDKSNLYSDSISFEEIKMRGYEENSSTYRQAQMKVLSDQYNIDTKMRDFNHALTVFYAKCGLEENHSLEDFINIFSSAIPTVEPVQITDFKKENYKEIEAAKWTYHINLLSRSAKKNFSLGANAGYTFGNTTGVNTKADTADIGVSSTIGGIKLTGGMSVPVTGNSHEPAFTASATFTPNTFKQNKILKENDALSEEQELLAITEAENKYDTTVVDKMQSLRDIEWQKSTNETSLQLYKEIADELKKYFESGFIKESEYLSAKTNVELYTIRQILNDIDLIIYNNEVKLLFLPLGSE